MMNNNKILQKDNAFSYHRNAKAARVQDELKNPCIQESQMSLQCITDNYYDKGPCELYFQNYKKCKDFWKQITNDRRKKGIEPYLPLPEERDKIKQEHFNVAS